MGLLLFRLLSLLIIGFKFDYLTLVEKEVVQFLDEFKDMSSCIIIALDRGEESETEKYTSLGSFCNDY